MTDEEEQPDDVASMMEKLWGPREEQPLSEIDAPSDALWGPRRGDGPPRPAPTESAAAPAGQREQAGAPKPQNGPSTTSAATLDAQRAQFEAVLDDQLAGLRAELAAALATVDARFAESDEWAAASLGSLRSELEASLSPRLDEVRAEGLAAVERRVDAAERELIARRDVAEREAVERLASVEERVDGELRRLSEEVDGVRDALARLAESTERRAPLDLDTLRSELETRWRQALADQRAEINSRVDQRLGELATQTSAALAEIAAKGSANAAWPGWTRWRSRLADWLRRSRPTGPSWLGGGPRSRRP